MSSLPDQCTQMEEQQQHLHHQAKKTILQHFQDRSINPPFLVLLQNSDYMCQESQ